MGLPGNTFACLSDHAKATHPTPLVSISMATHSGGVYPKQLPSSTLVISLHAVCGAVHPPWRAIRAAFCQSQQNVAHQGCQLRRRKAGWHTTRRGKPPVSYTYPRTFVMLSPNRKANWADTAVESRLGMMPAHARLACSPSATTKTRGDAASRD